MNIPKATIIGVGGLGKALACGLAAHGCTLSGIYNRTVSKANSLAQVLHTDYAGTFPQSQQELGKLIFLTVPDREIQPVAEQLSELGETWEGYTIVHCSGNESADLLQSLRNKGGTVASFHPLQTFSTESDSNSFHGIYFSMQGDKETFPLLKMLARQFNAHAFEVTEEQKSHLHAAAVMASNYLNTLIDAAADIAAISGLEKGQGKEALLPLITQTLENNRELTFAEALTGPIKRGDVPTVQKHLQLLRGHKNLHAMYVNLGLQTIERALQTAAIDQDTADSLRNILQ